MAGLDLRPDQHIDGISMVDLAKGSKESDQVLFWHYPHYGNQGGSPSSAIRKGDYKLIEFFEDGRTELYNLTEDIGEKNDLSARMPDLRDEMLKELHQWHKDVDARMPTKSPGLGKEIEK